jgi:hypothetical protein
LAANEKIELEQKIAGTTIRYTVDGTDPDSTTSPIYKGPISADGFTLIKAKKHKDGLV